MQGDVALMFEIIITLQACLRQLFAKSLAQEDLYHQMLLHRFPHGVGFFAEA